MDSGDDASDIISNFILGHFALFFYLKSSSRENPSV